MMSLLDKSALVAITIVHTALGAGLAWVALETFGPSDDPAMVSGDATARVHHARRPIGGSRIVGNAADDYDLAWADAPTRLPDRPPRDVTEPVSAANAAVLDSARVRQMVDIMSRGARREFAAFTPRFGPAAMDRHWRARMVLASARLDRDRGDRHAAWRKASSLVRLSDDATGSVAIDALLAASTAEPAAQLLSELWASAPSDLERQRWQRDIDILIADRPSELAALRSIIASEVAVGAFLPGEIQVRDGLIALGTALDDGLPADQRATQCRLETQSRPMCTMLENHWQRRRRIAARLSSLRRAF